MKRMIAIMTVGTALSAAVVSYLVAQPPAAKEGTPARRAGDEAAIKLAGLSFVKAYAAGDAKGMATHWTENGEYVAEDGTILRGRANIEKAYAEQFAKKKAGVTAEIEVTSIRFPSKDTAIEEGHFKVRVGKEPPTTSRYTVLHAREGDKWLMAVVREWPGDGQSLRDLEWLIGSWEAKRGDNVVKSTYEWWGDKSFLRATVSITTKEHTVNGFQMIGKEASGTACEAAKGLIAEGEEFVDAKGDDAVRDAALIIAAQRVEHYEISAYGSARTHAQHLGHDNAADLLQQTLDEEAATDRKLTDLAESGINLAAR